MSRIRQAAPGVPAFAKRKPDGSGMQWFSDSGEKTHTPTDKNGLEAYKRLPDGRYVSAQGVVIVESTAAEEPKTVTWGTADDWLAYNADWDRRLKAKETERATVQKLTQEQVVRQNQQQTAEVMNDFKKHQIEELFLDSDTPDFEDAVIARVQKEYGATSEPSYWSIVVTAERNERACRTAFSKMTVAEIRKTTAAQLSEKFFVTPAFAQQLLNDLAFEELVAAHRVK